jgi:hypothetical protein
MCKLKLILLTFSLLFSTSCFPSFYEQHKKDNKLIETFNLHRAQFNQILQIMQENCNDSKNQEKGLKLTDENLAKYKRLAKEIGFSEETFGNCIKDGVEFVDSVQGLAVSGSSKGYAFLNNKPEILTVRLDTYQHPNPDSYTAYRNIEGNWYLFFEFDN